MPKSDVTQGLPELVSFPPKTVCDASVQHYPNSRGGIRSVKAGAEDGSPRISKNGVDESDQNGALSGLSVQAGLEPYGGLLDERTARHLLRRTGMGASFAEVQAHVGVTATTAVDALVDAALTDPHPPTPSWVNTPQPGPGATDEEWMQYNDWLFQTLDQFRVDWLKMMTTHGLREKLTLFWHDHFATSEDKYYHVQIAQRYIELLRTHSLGNFKLFVREVGLNSAMLIFLDGVENRNNAPNENYARELCELFTMGIHDKNGLPNYTEDDIKEIARGLTGYVVDRDFQVLFFNFIHDGNSKTFFGQSGTWGYDDVIDIVFAQRQQETAWYICKKLYQEFVYEVADDAIVQELADLFIANNFEIAPVVRTLLKSAHFFDTQVVGSRITSPTELTIRLLKEVGGYVDEHFLIAFYASWGLEQVLTLVPSVNGWPRHRNWISTTTMPERWAVCAWMVWEDQIAQRLDINSTLEQLVDFQDPHLAFRVGPALVEHLFSIQIDELDIEEITAPFAGDLTTHPIPQDVQDAPAYVRNLSKMFLNGIPWYEWSPYNTAQDWALRVYVAQLAQIPEFPLT